jgi:hypothetical protein
MQIPRAVGPLAAGVLFHNGLLALPFFIAGIFQGGYLLLYRKTFLRHDRSVPARE